MNRVLAPPALLHGIPADLMQTVFPFHFVFDRDNKVVQYGENLLHLCPTLARGANIDALFRINTPIGLSMCFDAIASQMFSAFFVECRATKHIIKGQMLILDGSSSGLMLFLGSPFLRDVEDVKRLGLSFNDFALHDATIDLLFLLETKASTIMDVRSLAERLRQEVRTRRDAERALQGMNQVLEQRVQQRTAELGVAKNRAELANTAKSTFLSNMSHELRTPLNAILGYAQVLQLDKKLTQRQNDGLHTIQQSGEHLLALITDLLDVGKIEANKLELYPEPLNLAVFLEDIMAMMRVPAEQKNLTLLYAPTLHLPRIVVLDEKRLRQILLNILGNAIKFTDSGQVSLRVATTDAQASRLRFDIEDSGVGIAAEQLENIFNPFEQVGAQQKKVSGTGLGLAISQRLIRLMGSNIHVISTPGKGSTFWFELSLTGVVPDSPALAHSQAATPLSHALIPEPTAFITPPAAQMEHLYNLALEGNMRKINQYAAQCLESDVRYRAFVTQLHALASQYQTKAMLTFITQHRAGTSIG